MNKKPSIKDIAREAGISIATVSYVLNNKYKDFKISEEMAAKVRAVAARLNYQPSFIARSLKSGTTKTIGLVLEDISNPFFGNLASIIEKEAQAAGYTVIIGCHYEESEKSERLIDTLLTRQVDGIIITPVDGSEQQVLKLQAAGMPFVLVDRYFSSIPSNTVTINNFDIAYQAVSHLLQQGYRQVGMIAFRSGFEHMDDRINGYKQALKDHGIKVPAGFLQKVDFHDVEKGIRNALTKLLSRSDRADALFFVNNVTGMAALNVIHKMKLVVPDELGLVSFDQRDAFDYFYSPLTYIEQNLKEIGEQAVKLLVRALGDKKAKPIHQVVAAKLIIRDSSMLTPA